VSLGLGVGCADVFVCLQKWIILKCIGRGYSLLLSEYRRTVSM